MENKDLINKIESLLKRRAFVYPSSEIYGGFGSVYDFGPMGCELKNNIKNNEYTITQLENAKMLWNA